MRVRSDASPTLEMIGKRFHRLTVLSVAGHTYRDGAKNHITILTRCDCGNERLVEAYIVRQGRVRQCKACARASAAKYNREHASVRLPSGKTIAILAAEVGLRLETVYGRWRRGWPEQELTRPIFPPGHGRDIP